MSLPLPGNKFSRREVLLLGVSAGAAAAAHWSRRFFKYSGSPETPDPMVHSTPMERKYPPAKNTLRAVSIYTQTLERFSGTSPGSFHEYSKPAPQDPPAAYLWPYLGVVSCSAALASTRSSRRSFLPDFLDNLSHLSAYYDPASGLPAYNSLRTDLGAGLRYYDDNEWLGWSYIDAYHLTGYAEYLEQAIAAYQYAISGWSSDLGGGIYWREADTTTKNACSNGPAAVLALRLFEITGSRHYLDMAMRILAWLETLHSPQDVYWDSISSSGAIDKRLFTYNTATPLYAYALLYQLTEKPEYLQTARNLARACQQVFPSDVPVTSPAARARWGDIVRIYPETPWFNMILLRAFIALYNADPQRDLQYIDHFRLNLDYAWENARTPDGGFSPDWTGKTGMDTSRRWLLDQAAMGECYALISPFD